MSSAVYHINKGINRPIEFKGVKGQYILYLGASLVCLLLVFAILYVVGINIYICLLIIIPVAIAIILTIQRLSHKYGEFGLMKKIAQKRLPSSIKSNSRKPFIDLVKPKI